MVRVSEKSRVTNGEFHVFGYGFFHLQELYLDGGRFVLPFDHRGITGIDFEGNHDGILDALSSDEDQNHRRFYMLRNGFKLERLSMKGCTWVDPFEEEKHAISQEMIMKMVRRLDRLRWLRSDLTNENLALLQQERPEITFVTD